MLIRRLKIALVAVLLAASPPVAAAGESDILYQSLVGAFFSAQKQHQLAAKIFGELGQRLDDPEFVRAAVFESIVDKDFSRALQYAEAWAQMGGGAAAKQVTAELLLLSGDFIAAERELRILMDEHHQSAEELYWQLSRAADGQAAVAIGKRLFADDAESQSFLARLAAKDNDWRAMEEAIDRGLVADNKFVLLHFLRFVLARQKDGGEAVWPAVQKYLAAGCPGAESGCDEAIVLLAYTRFTGGDKEWQSPLREADKHRNSALLAAGEFFERRHLPGKAAESYRPVADIFFNARLGLARIARDRGGLREAADILQKSPVKNRSELTRREATLAYLLKDLDESPRALARIADARRSFPDDRSLLYAHSVLLEDTGDIDGAVDLLAKLTLLYPKDGDAWNALGYMLADHNRRLREAEQHILRALAIEPGEPNFLDSLGWVKYRLGELPQALDYLRQAVQKSDAAEIAAHLGEVLWRLDSREEAREVWRASLKKHPDNKVLNDTLRRFQQSP